MNKEELFSKVIADIIEINKSETKSIPVKIIKFNEEWGEFNAEVIKMLGETYKEYSEEELKSEMADVFQVMLSIYTEIFKTTNITIESLLEEVLKKDKKWLEKIKDYTKNK
jgi:predicted house-cleaning noncanonical NTP pyrophosphatase (MazG superfamily)